jgi:hypothetical protein
MIFAQSVFTPQWWQELFQFDSREGSLFRITIGAILTLGLYSILYRENKFYRFTEHVFVGLATGFSVVALVKETLYPMWWLPMIGTAPDPSKGIEMVPAHFAYGALLPIACLAFFVFSKKHGWLSRIPLGIIVGLWAGQQLDAFQNRFLPQIADQARPILPLGQTTVPDAINNLIVVATWIIVLSYFVYSFEQQSKFLQRTSMMGRWLLMVGFGAIFGTTMMTRFVLFIDRAYFLLIEWLRLGKPL